SVDVDRVVASGDDLSEETMRESLAPRSICLSGEEPVQIVVVLRVDVDAAFVEPRTVQQGNDEDRSAHGVGRDSSAEADRRLDPGVLRGVDARRDQQSRAGYEPCDGDVRPLVFREALVTRERERTGGPLARGRDLDRTDLHSDLRNASMSTTSSWTRERSAANAMRWLATASRAEVSTL